MQKVAFWILIVLISEVASAQNLSSQWEQGDDAYKKQDYAKAQEHYEKEGKRKQEAPALDYNTGNAYFQLQKTEEARKKWDKALDESKDKNLSADALHNIGNSYLAEKKYKEAIDAYQKSLRNRPNDEATKKNLQIAKKQLQQQQQQQQKQQQQQQNQDQQKEQQQQQQQGQQNKEEQQGNSGENQERPSEQPIDRQNAERLLQILDKEEQKVQQKVKEQSATKRQRSRKDW